MKYSFDSSESTALMLTVPIGGWPLSASFFQPSLPGNLGGLRARSVIREFVIGQKTEEIAEKILAGRPRIVGLGVYIWNVEESTRLVAQLKVLSPETLVVLGGPEVSYETAGQRITALADYVITGWGDVSFRQLCEQLLADERPAA